MIENVAKSVRRKQTVDEDYMKKLFDDVKSLYRLDQLSATAVPGARDLGPLPRMSVALLSCIAGVWVLLGVFTAAGYMKKKKATKL